MDGEYNPSYSTLYPDVLKIKTIIVVKQIFGKMSFVYYLQIYKSISGYAAAWTFLIRPKHPHVSPRYHQKLKHIFFD